MYHENLIDLMECAYNNYLYLLCLVPSVHFLRDKEFSYFFSHDDDAAQLHNNRITHIFCVNKHHTLNPNGPSNERAAALPDHRQTTKNIRDAIP